MKYKILAMDMDDTLLKNDLSISLKTKEALKKAKEKGLIIVLASGRPTSAMDSFAKELDLHKGEGYIISYNGAFVKNCVTDETIFKQSLSKEYLHEIYDLSKEHNVYLHTYLDDFIVTDNNNKYTEIESKLTNISIKVVDNLKEYVNGEVIKAIALEEPNYLKEVRKKVETKVGDKMSVTISKPYFLEFMDKGVDKGKALELLAKKINVDINKVVAVGDSYNDLTMIQAAGLGVAMGNANEDVKKAATIIVKDNENDGIAELINNYILKDE